MVCCERVVHILTLKASYPKKLEKVEADDYIPLTITWESTSKYVSSNLYWRVKTNNCSLLEIGLSAEKGEVQSLTIVQYNGVIEENYEVFSTSDDIEVIEGLPAFDATDWPQSGYMDVDGDFRMYRHSESMMITLLQTSQITKVVQNNRVVFRFNEQEQLVSIKVQI